jgi:sporulation protein YlmC with PRC-barrel domain
MGEERRMPALLGLTEAEPGAAGGEEDLRGRRLRDNAGAVIGTVEELLIDEPERQGRLLRVSGRRLVPVDAIVRIGPDTVCINRSAAHVAATPALPSQGEDQAYLESVYAHYGYYPFWAPGYAYPSYPAYPPE